MSAAAEVATEVVETVADAAEDTIEALDMINNLNGTTRKQQLIVLIAVGAAAGAAGAVFAHLLTKRMLKTKYEMLMEEELEKTREFFANRTYVEPDALEHPVDPEEMLAEVSAPKTEMVDYSSMSRGNEFVDKTEGPAVISEERLAAIAAVDEVEAQERNAFDENVEADWEIATEQNRQAKKPYVISKDEFFENDMDWPQFTFTWFEGDGVLADEKEDMVADPDNIAGNWNLERFGWKSQDPNTVYVRVPEHEMEVEVIKSEGTFAAEVHGFTHSDDDFERRRKGGRVRFGDD